MRKICVVTATRAEYGLLKPLMGYLFESERFELQTLVTGAHLSPEFGLTYRFLEEDGFQIDEKVEMLLSADTPTGIVKSMGLGMIGYAEAFSRLSPDAVIILGDRYEMLSVASAATIFNIPIIHLHGGEITEGAYDDAIRHAISKLSALHFASTEGYRKRVIQMGEQPEQVYNVGAIGLDNISGASLFSREELEANLGIRFKKYNYQVTFHPETLSDLSSEEQFRVLLEAVEEQADSYFIFTKANADTDGRVINQMIDDYVAKNPDKASAHSSLGSLRFLSVVNICDAIIGNSSSGIIEAPSLKTPTINIGDRQRGRIQAESVLNCNVEKEAIMFAFDKVKDASFQASIREVVNPYGDGNTVEKIGRVLTSIDLNKLRTKKFYNISIS
ncbi:UDP-N-acetylglucosamine 2-epimerase [Sphingobacterium gobiense]|uniref:UDP-N-acetylglucosamine 2-epimerase (Hydrolyzing) n=1 Tax=Sphingobacterium gobiense TaxID=1382456 RepID=A0A2S9JG62_9SPHI|nr:UDP-N-acetylglucosamine 2-epimerase [Sphingobacterium gobiense]PRD51944.1 UDP-N-acetylglucosamine 2-epimerase (hydrolyzing) [Sphingobacterium gobiense]